MICNCYVWTGNTLNLLLWELNLASSIFRFCDTKYNQNKIKMTTVSAIEKGTRNADSFRMYFMNDNGPISPVHDIPLWYNREQNLVNMIVEMPRWTNAKLEVSMTDALNPIRQDAKEGVLRYVKNCFPYHGIPWNYGCVPQTWEHPDSVDEITKYKGDGDPLDIVDIGQSLDNSGEIIQVKVLGVLAVIDEKKIDWKIIGVNVKDDAARLLNGVEDIECKFPRILDATKEWLKNYKVHDSRPLNEIAFDGKVQDRQMALDVVENVHRHWQQLIQGKNALHGIFCSNVSISGSPFKIPVTEAKQILEKSPPRGKPKPMDPGIDKWYFRK